MQQLREIPTGLFASPVRHILGTLLLCGALIFLDSFGLYASLAILFISIISFIHRFRGPGIDTPDECTPLILLLHPFGSERRHILLLHWISAAVWQFGQPVLPLDCESKSAKMTRAPNQPAWRRHRTTFFRVLDRENWHWELPDLIRNASLIIMDTTLCRVNLAVELAAIEANGKMHCTVSIHQIGQDEKRKMYSAAGDSVSRVIDNSIGYSLDTPRDLILLWQQVVSRGAQTLGIPEKLLKYQNPPPVLSFNPKYLLIHLNRLPHDEADLAQFVQDTDMDLEKSSTPSRLLKKSLI